MTEFRHSQRLEPDRGPAPPKPDDRDAKDTTPAAVIAAAVERLRATGHLYFELEPTGPSGIAVTVRHHRPEDAALAEYADHVYTDDPLTAAFRDHLQRGEAVVHGPAIVALGELPRPLRASYENRFLRRAGIADVLGLGVPVSIDGRARMLCFGFHRSAADPGFTVREKRALARLADGLRSRAETLALREALALQATIGRTLAMDAARGWMLLDDRLQVRQQGGAPQAFGATGGVAGAANALRDRLRGRPRTGPDDAVALRTGPDTLGLVAEPLWVAGGVRWWLVRSQPQTSAADPATIPAASGLTERERQLAGLLLRGQGNRELARELGLTVNTVENHLRSIYAKLGVRSRGQAIARMLGTDAPAIPGHRLGTPGQSRNDLRRARP